jgi:hypothetical protein
VIARKQRVAGDGMHGRAQVGGGERTAVPAPITAITGSANSTIICKGARMEE